jgi:hypothetical protein
MSDRRSIDAINSVAAGSSDNYVTTNLRIDRTDEETRNVISNTFGAIKNNLDMLWSAIGLDANVTYSYNQTLSNPDLAMEFNGRKYYPHTGVGNLRPYNEMGNPSGGCFSLYTMG